MAKIVEWPLCLLSPRAVSADIVPFTRTGGRTLGGIETATRTDLGYWVVQYSSILIENRDRRQWQTWQAVRQLFGGRAGHMAMPIVSSLSAPYASGRYEPRIETQHSDQSLFDDGSSYIQGAINIVSHGVTPLGATTMQLRIVNAADNLVGVRFSYRHALYETGPVIDVNGDIWTVPVSPSVRAPIPSGSELEFDYPTVLCRLAEDRGMDITADGMAKIATPSISFVEDTDYWYRLAKGLV